MSAVLNGKVAVLTGGGGGIGSAVAVKLAQCGMKIVLLGGNNPEKLEKTRLAVEKYAPCLVLPGDLTDLDFISCAVALTVILMTVSVLPFSTAPYWKPF